MVCTYCHGTGFKGQVGVFEFLEMNMDLANALRANNSIEFIQRVKEDPNHRSLTQCGLEAVKQGITTVREVIRIIGEETE